MPCQICNDFKGSREKLEPGKGIDLGTRNHVKIGLHWDEITASAESCFICEVLTRGIRGTLQQHGIKESDITSFSIYFYYEDAVGYTSETNKEFHFQLANGSEFDIELFAVDEPDAPIPLDWETFPVSDRTSPRTDSDAAMAKIQGWIEECLGPTDEFCTAPTEAELPTRVIDVGIGDSLIRLVEPCGRVARYICLSHCWGKQQIITTTKSTMRDRMAGIKMEHLSKTFQDAVILTRRLGVQYIWIDSLCIVQDDLRDWEAESTKMCDIYSKAYLTISATHSRDGRGGLFRETPDFEVSGVAPGAGGGEYRFFFRERIDHHLEQSPDNGLLGEIGHATMVHYPIFTRAWVYQERMLSTRVLHFGQYEVFFECRSAAACECDGIGYVGSSAATGTLLPKVIHSDALDSQMEGVEWVEYAQYYIARLWRTMVSSFTSLAITKHGDRLPAMGGLAKHMAMRTKSVYLAGLWEDTLMDDLLWCCDGGGISKPPRPAPRAAPTWSWASIDCDISYTDGILFWEAALQDEEREPHQHFARIEDCTVIPSGVDEFGTLLQGRLQISGLIATGVLERATEIREGKGSAVYHVLFPGGIKTPVSADYALEEPGNDQVLPGAEVKCLKMSWMQCGAIKVFMSLVLRPVAGAPGMYERIGCIQIKARVSASLIDPVEPVYRSAIKQTVVII
ncbi:heterokaryon incompatibility protein-domain-containing protein [Chaetomium fimeti]|uniref:Heterokaryon incompatibility protein-domain-containing protein n=1 Tax=Chaetomium fimeti TaxID=1854472 RepID=A0AAE0LVH4_9PEZI|nr:heterokaryon incompatibility protein-domain-containing protein [Chaetomium fimeti]